MKPKQKIKELEYLLNYLDTHNQLLAKRVTKLEQTVKPKNVFIIQRNGTIYGCFYDKDKAANYIKENSSDFIITKLKVE